MMNYELFKEVVVEKIKSFMPEEFSDYGVSIRSTMKVNRTLDGLCMVPTDDKSSKIAPTIYINYMYDEYMKCDDLEKVLHTAALVISNGLKDALYLNLGDKLSTASDSIVMVLVNTEQNRELLKNVPNRPFHDLSIIYRWVVDETEDGINSTIIRYGLAEKLGMKEDDLYKAAFANTARLFPPTVKAMNDVIREIMLGDGTPIDIVNMMIADIPKENMMYVISNEKGINGAASLLYEEHLFQLAEKVGTDMIIMPSSVHEIIAVSANMGTPDELSNMVEEINFDQVDICDRLSNQVYFYDRTKREISIASRNSNKRLDKAMGV